MVLGFVILINIFILKCLIINKSTEELIYKIKKGDCRFSKSMKMNKIERYFNQSNPNIEKINLIEKSFGVNLTKYKSIES